MLTRIKSIYIVWGIGLLAIAVGNVIDLLIPSEPVKSGLFEGITIGGGITFAAFALFILYGFWQVVREAVKDFHKGNENRDMLKG